MGGVLIWHCDHRADAALVSDLSESICVAGFICLRSRSAAIGFADDYLKSVRTGGTLG